MANQNFMNILDPSASADQIQLDRRMKMAEILRQQSMEPDQNQVAGGFVIPTSPFASLNKIASGFLAGKMNSDTDKQRKDMAQRQSTLLLNALKGDSPQTTVLPQSPVSQDASGKPLYDNSQTVTQPSQNSQFDLKNLIRGSAIGQVGGDQAAGAYWEGMKPTTEMKNAAWMGQDPKLLSQLDIAAKRKAGMMELQPGATSLDLTTGQERFNPKVGEGITINNGVASQLPGYAEANAGIQGSQAGAIEGAKAQWNPMKIDLATGPTMLTQSQIAQGAQGKNGVQGIPLQTATQSAQEKAAAQGSVDLPKTIDTANQLVSNIDDLIKHPGLKTAVGHVYSGTSRLIPGTDAADFAARESQIGGQTFLQAYTTLRGGGQITEVEGAKAQAALNRANLAQSADDYVKAMTEYRDVIQKGVDRARQTAKGDFTPPATISKPLTNADLHSQADAILRGR